MKPLVIYHANCADGFGAAFAAWLTLGDEAEYVACQYGEKSYNLPFAYRDVYILDFSLPRDWMGCCFNIAKHVVWLDHHKTAFEMWCDTEREYHCENSVGEIILDNNKSGAMLAWEYFHPGTEVPLLIKHIDDYDRWQFKIEGTKALNKALWSYAPWSFQQWKSEFLDDPSDAHGLSDIGLYGLLHDGEAILRAHDQNVQSVVKGSARVCWLEPFDRTKNLSSLVDLNSLPGLSANCPAHLTSDVGHALATQSGTFGLCWCLGKDGTMAKCSLRSNGDYDVSSIAKPFGGGGHRNAAGFEVPVETLLGWLR